MNKISRIISGVILIIIGVGVIIFGITLISGNQNWTGYTFIGSTIILGIGVILGGWAIIKGEKIKDILEIIIISLR